MILVYKVVIGLEVHCELSTNSKNFSHAKNTFSTEPNTCVAPVDLGLPGILPYINEEATFKALKVAKALKCTLPDEIIFDRKNYFYPDLPKGYQITQVTKPMGKNGNLMIRVGDEIKSVDITQIHLEEDTASLEHFSNFSLLDYNRSGIPLIEIVTEPCISSAEEAIAFLAELRSLFLYLGVSEADSKKGQMRCDVNISLMKETDTEFGTKVEMKNINAFNIVRSSIEYEIKRQTEILDKGEKVLQQTRRFSEETGKTTAMRDKVDAVDYKYFIEPNLAPVKVTDEMLDKIKSEVPELKFDKIEKYHNEFGLSIKDSENLAKEREVAEYFENVIAFGVKPQEASSWVITVILGSLNKLNVKLSEMFITPKMLADVLLLVESDKLSIVNAKNVLYEAMDIKKEPIEIIKEKNIRQIDDESELENIVEEIVRSSPDVINDYINGNETVANFLIGKVMQKTNKQANPKIAKKLIVKFLERIKNEK